MVWITLVHWEFAWLLLQFNCAVACWYISGPSLYRLVTGSPPGPLWFIVVLPQVRNEGRQRKRHGKPKGGGKSGAQLKSKSWVLKKKAQMRGKGYTAIPVDTKYTARKRKKGF
jgi:hypothetical protein